MNTYSFQISIGSINYRYFLENILDWPPPTFMFAQLWNRLYVKGTYIYLHKSDVLDLFTLSVVVLSFLLKITPLLLSPPPLPAPYHSSTLIFCYLCIVIHVLVWKTNCRIIEQFVTITFGPYLHTHITQTFIFSPMHIRAFSQGNFSIQYTYIKKRIFFYYVNYNFYLFL